MTAPDCFRFLSVEQTADKPSDWNNPSWPKLWLYNLHYFDDLLAAGAADRSTWHQSLIKRWIAENPPGYGNGWEPYPTSIRIVNWVQWLTAGNQPVAGMLDSLGAQARWLRRRLEYHLLGNHLWSNAKALVFAGIYFEGAEAESWLRTGLRIIRRELKEQILPDGGHFERSPMYHGIALVDLIDLVQLADRSESIPQDVRQKWRTSIVSMLRWIEYMTHPDGGISFFNDAAMGISADLDSISAYARSVGIEHPGCLEPLLVMRCSGYARMLAGDAVLISDVGNVGPDYLPGHAHADTLSFELSVGGKRQLVNRGTSTYQDLALRAEQRSTLAHNTVVVDRQDSSEVWAAFRVARRAKVHDVRLWEESGAALLSAWHDGYLRLRGRVRHERRWCLRACQLEVTDKLEGKFETAEARYHFAPGAELSWSVIGGEAHIEPSSWHPRFGESVPIEVLVVRFTEAICSVVFEWGEG